MAGRPKKKPEYNPELQFNNFLQELRDAYEEADSLRSLADELNISLLKLRKLLITADVFTSDICTEINDLYQSGKDTGEIQKVVMKDEVKPTETPTETPAETPETTSTPETKDTETTKTSTSPKTGDNTPILFWVLLAGVGMAGVGGTVILRKKKKK